MCTEPRITHRPTPQAAATCRSASPLISHLHVPVLLRLAGWPSCKRSHRQLPTLRRHHFHPFTSFSVATLGRAVHRAVWDVRRRLRSCDFARGNADQPRQPIRLTRMRYTTHHTRLRPSWSPSPPIAIIRQSKHTVGAAVPSIPRQSGCQLRSHQAAQPPGWKLLLVQFG